MASNPIQRRARQSFLVGFLIALVIMAVIVVFLFMKISKLNEEKESLKVAEITVYTTVEDLKSGSEITAESLMPITVRAELDVTNYITSSSFEYDEQGNPIKYFTKVDIAAGTMITENMIYKDGEATANDERILEYNMIVLPSQLQNGDYVDIRLRLANGADYIVLSKKYIEQTTAKAIWMKMSEIDIMTLNSAIVESYLVDGAKLYATKYTEPGMQEAASATYAVNQAVLQAINANPNILEDARQDLVSKWNKDSDASDGKSDFAAERDTINGYMADKNEDEKASTVAGKDSEETANIAAARDEYVSQLEGTGLIGTSY